MAVNTRKKFPYPALLVERLLSRKLSLATDMATKLPVTVIGYPKTAEQLE